MRKIWVKFCSRVVTRQKAGCGVSVRRGRHHGQEWNPSENVLDFAAVASYKYNTGIGLPRRSPRDDPGERKVVGKARSACHERRCRSDAKGALARHGH